MALYAFDGTWNSVKSEEDPQYENTNVVRFYNAYRKHSGTQDFYVAGVGTRFDLVGKLVGGFFGMGELTRINEAYDHLCQQWANGDKVIDVVGFSRGAATTLDFCQKVKANGIRKPNSDAVVEPTPKIRFVGVWDVVGAFGLASLGFTDLNIGHHLSLPKESLDYCFHAMALDEQRPSFLQTRLFGATEVWFRGVHSDIGGGNKNPGLNDITLKWMFSKAKAAQLPILAEDIAALHPDPATPPKPVLKLPVNVRLISAVDHVHYTVTPLNGATNPPATCIVETAADEQVAKVIGALEVIPPAMRRNIAALWESAAATAAQLNIPIDGARDALLTLFQGRSPLIITDSDLVKARHSTVQLVVQMAQSAAAMNFHVLREFHLNEALFHLRPLYPFTD
jgi:uncharacterized protein (DUF2235 family)